MENIKGACAELALPGDQQINFLQKHGVPVDELALGFDDMYKAAKGVVNTRKASRALDELDTALAEISCEGCEEMWTHEALLTAYEWSNIRILAATTLDALNVDFMGEI